ncbi:MAG TPA: HAD family hydrolase [Candidatus Methylomirabilis sp.]|nr:HAD family hydrolase [Candidatus Methylomirabilis sp.]
MRITPFTALACDYDGTLASEDHMGAEVLGALERAREVGLRLILVTGRTFFELVRVCERLDLFDGVVAENGGVLYFPAEGRIRDLAPTPPLGLLAELDRREIAFHVGRVVVGTTRTAEAQVREALAAVGATLAIFYNRDALMLLPAGISKGSGVRHMIRHLGLSFHDVLALGDAENDLELFEACGWAACPANGVPELKERADWIFDGVNGEAIARGIRGPMLGGLLSLGHSRRHRIAVGWAVKTSEPVTVPARGVNLLIQGDPLSGKSWLAGALVERLVSHQYAVCVLDPEGDFHILARLPGVLWAEIRDGASLDNALNRIGADPSACIVVDFSRLPHGRKVEMVERSLNAIRELRRRLGLPHWVVLDEAQYLLHQGGVADEAIGIEDRGFCLITYRLSWLRASVRKAVDVLIAARTTLPEEVASLRAFLAETFGKDGEATSVLPHLPAGEFLLLHAEATEPSKAVTFVPIPRETAHVRHRKKYADVLLPPEQRFYFRAPEGRVAAVAGSLNEFVQALATTEERVLAYHAARKDFSRWIIGVFNDQDLGRAVRKLESRSTRGEIPNLCGSMQHLVAHYYGSES